MDTQHLGAPAERSVMTGQTSGELARKLLDEAIAYGQVEVAGENEDGTTLYRFTP